MSKNYCIIRNEKIKSVSTVSNVLNEMLPDEESERTSPRAVKELSYLNDNSSTSSKAFEEYKKLLPKNVRKNAVVGCMQLVSTSEEFLSPVDEKKYYEDARKFIEKKFGKIVAWSIHRDETSTHMQVVTIPLVDGKLNARALIGGSKYKMREVQNAFHEEVGKQFGLERGEEKSSAVHKTVEQYHREQAQKLFDEKEKLEEEKKRLEELDRELLKRSEELNRQITQTNEQIALFEQDKKRFDFHKDFEDLLTKTVEKSLADNSMTEKTSPSTLFEALKTFSKKFKEASEKVKKVLLAPLETVENWCHEARKKGCKNLEEYLYPRPRHDINRIRPVKTPKEGRGW